VRGVYFMKLKVSSLKVIPLSILKGKD
jgi:hypothetical protein